MTPITDSAREHLAPVGQSFRHCSLLTRVDPVVPRVEGASLGAMPGLWWVAALVHEEVAKSAHIPFFCIFKLLLGIAQQRPQTLLVRDLPLSTTVLDPQQARWIHDLG